MKLLSEPDSFFAELKCKKVRIRRPMMIVAILASIASYYQLFIFEKISKVFPQDLAEFLKILSYINVFATFLGFFATWLIFATIMHGLSAFFDGKGSFRRTFEFAGYGFLPNLIGATISIPNSIYFISSIEIPKSSNFESIEKALAAIVPKEIVYSNLILNFAISTWSLLIWSFAIKNAREIELRKAFICALIPTAISLIYQIIAVREFL